MSVTLICERFDRWPESVGVSPVDVAAALVRAGRGVTVVCDCVQSLDPVPGVTVHTMRGERWRIVRRPEAFRPWALSHPALRSADLSISLCPGVEAALWAPGVNWGWRAIRDEFLRTGLYTAAKRAAPWLLPRTRAARAALRSTRRAVRTGLVTLIAPDAEHAHRLGLQSGAPRERIALVGRFSGAPAPPTQQAERAAVRATLGIDPSARVALMAIDRSRSKAVACWRDALDLLHGPPPVLLLTGGKMMATLLHHRREGGCRVIGVGRTERFPALAAACDAAIVPAAPSGMLDDALAADALRLGLPVVAGRDRSRSAPGVEDLTRRFPARIQTVSESSAAIDERVAALRRAFDTTREPIQELSIDALVQRLLQLARERSARLPGRA